MTNCRPLPPFERLNELFEIVYIPKDKYGKWSGLVWKVNRRGKSKTNHVAGYRRVNKSANNRADWIVKIDGISYLTSRVLYFLTANVDPGIYQIDHIDRNSDNNNFTNLRLASHNYIQNNNKGFPSTNTSGAIGVCWDKKRKKWQTQIREYGNRRYLGLFSCKRKAAFVYNQAVLTAGLDKVGKKLNDLARLPCTCAECSILTQCPSDPAE